MIGFRELRLDDVFEMYKTISDKDVSNNFVFTRFSFSIETLEEYIKDSWGNKLNINYAITDNSKYVGTVSLKNINYIDRNAEYAIVLNKKYWGTEYSHEATKFIVEYGFNKLNLHKIYLNVLASNLRANKFYEKFGFVQEATFKQHMYVLGEYEDLIWYYVLNSDYNNHLTTENK